MNMRLPSPLRIVRTAALFGVAVSMLSGCPRAQSPIERAVHYLALTQTRHDCVQFGHVDYKGNWPQVFYFQHVRGYRIPDVSPFVVSFAHHALCLVQPDAQSQLDVSDASIAAAASMRQNAIACLRRFEAHANAPDAGTYGFWPYDADPRPGDSPLEQFLFSLLQGPLLGGTRAPVNLSYYPSQLAIPTDADVTATTYAAFLDDATLDGGPGTSRDFENFFADWRDLGKVPLRFSPDWLPSASGAYLTWLMYRPPCSPQYGNDIDLVVNANILFALGRYDRTGTPGINEAVTLINKAVHDGLHRTRWSDISLYYPDSYVFHYCVSRAFHDGPVAALKPAVDSLQQELLKDAMHASDGTVYWDKGNPQLNTAFALLTLMNAGTDSGVIDDGIHYLESRQNPATGAWDEAPFFIARADGGEIIEWASAPLTTAVALEALCRYRLRSNP